MFGIAGCQPEPESIGHELEFAQEPPQGSAVWLHCKTTKAGEIAPSNRQHVFAPSVSVRLVTPGLSVDEQRSILEHLTVTLYNSSFEDVTTMCLHVGQGEIKPGTNGGSGTVTWPDMACIAISASTATGATKEAQSAAALESARGAKGYFHMKVSGPNCDDLWLRDEEGKYGRIVIKSERLCALNREKGTSWEQLRKGPYASHFYCQPSHIGATGECNCCSSI